MTPTNDQSIIKAVANGDTLAYAQLVDRYKDLVFNVALKLLQHREEAEEVAQDTFIKVFKQLSSFKGQSKLSTWIYKIAYNNSLDRLKKNKKYRNDVPIDGFTTERLKCVDNALEQLIEAEKQQLIKNSLAQLPEDYRLVLQMFYFEDLSLQEMAEIINIEANTVKVKLFRARKKLATILEETMQQQHKIMYYGTG
ncbi:MAG: sigma-70 family RNA polymerase sigma factor [Winogradskyella sp.]|nr:sigma-70 family RNA polymerase sigma factor [Winogradskyella sp.]MBT8375805.1 sigma-70 family RNA polymerase sigma factor [Bacteroidia bacterium]NNC45423.1 sigma-70 family RNA polymerase sigma factor [Winogradskyella sp.]NNF86126.1 sigma-70 family RNA polymerase sigma factor [Winogradskyella sp.]NNK39512.1 sigma-70 family RNA polymerase sigma factor [Winogradskyella sp.]